MIFNVNINTKSAVGNIKIVGVGIILSLIKSILRFDATRPVVLINSDGFLEINVDSPCGTITAVSENIVTESDAEHVKFLNNIE